MEWISHDDRTLKEHLLGLKEVADLIIHEKTQAFFDQSKFKKQVYSLIAYHDLAKASTYFQLYLASALIKKGTGHKNYSVEELQTHLAKKRDKLVELLSSGELKEHALFGSWASLALDEKNPYSITNLLFSKILKRHHGYLRDFGLATMNPAIKKDSLQRIAAEIDFEEYTVMVNSLGLEFRTPAITQIIENFSIRNFKKIEQSIQTNTDSSYYYRTLFLFSILLSADKGDVMLRNHKLTRLEINSEIVDSFKTRSIQSNLPINMLREEAYNIALKRTRELGSQSFFFSITLPTGLGKTLTSLKVALSLKEQFHKNFRIIYCLPYTSIIDQNAIVLKNIMETAALPSEAIGVHHHLASPDDNNDDDFSFSEWEYFTEGWQNELTITTFVQLWESIFANHNRQLRKYHNLVNSIIILDEIQALRPALLPAFEFAIQEMAKYFNTTFLFVTATQPIILKGKMIELCLNGKPEYFFSKLNRTILSKLYLQKGIIPAEGLADIVIRNKINNDESILIICNTIRFSQDLFEAIRDKLPNNDIFYLSAAIIPYSREKILREQIKALLQSGRPAILISTQVIEAGVDIDFDVVYRDFAPMSSINQAAGRCNRNSMKNPSKVYLFRSGKENIYDPTLLSITEKTLGLFSDEIPESMFFDLNQKFFEEVKRRIQDYSGLSESLIQSILSLKFEEIGKNKDYRILLEQYKSHNYFIPINNEALEVWNQYLDYVAIKEHFKRKSRIRTLAPKLMKYVVRIPDYILKPSSGDKDKAIIYDEDWQTFYDEKMGYKLPSTESRIEVF